jgi:high-affinity nickel permease
MENQLDTRSVMNALLRPTPRLVETLLKMYPIGVLSAHAYCEMLGSRNGRH